MQYYGIKNALELFNILPRNKSVFALQGCPFVDQHQDIRCQTYVIPQRFKIKHTIKTRTNKQIQSAWERKNVWCIIVKLFVFINLISIPLISQKRMYTNLYHSLFWHNLVSMCPWTGISNGLQQHCVFLQYTSVRQIKILNLWQFML